MIISVGEEKRDNRWKMNGKSMLEPSKNVWIPNTNQDPAAAARVAHGVFIPTLGSFIRAGETEQKLISVE